MKLGWTVMKSLLLAVTLVPAVAVAQAPSCFNDKILQITSSGNLIRLQSGQLFKVYPGEGIHTLFWLPLDKVRVCQKGGAAYQITGPKGVAVDALRQF